MFESIKKIWNFSTARKKQLVKILILSFLEGSFIMIKMFAVIVAVNLMFNQTEMENHLYKIIGLGLVYIIGVFALGYFTQLNSVSVGFNLAKDKRLFFGSFFKRIYLGFFNENSVGSINTTLTTSISYIEQVGPILLIYVVGGILSSISIIIGFIYYEWRISILVFFATTVYLLAVNNQIKVSRKEAPKRQSAQTNLTSACIEFIQGIGVIKSFNAADKDKKIKKSIDESCSMNINLAKKTIPSNIYAGFTIRFFEILIIVFTFFMWKANIFDPQKSVNLLIMSFVVFQSINQAGSILSMLGILDSVLKDVETIENASEIKTSLPIEDIKSNKIEFKNVNFSYGTTQVLKNISATIEPNSITAIIGYSGSGKTTFCKLIPRFYDIDDGEILIGGAKITNIPINDLLKKITVVFQNVYLFEDTVLNNIRFAKPDASDEEIIEAAKKAGCHDFIKKLPDGYQTKLSEGGNTLSGGEKQRISIARAILKDAPIVILDEFTSALDMENEYEILNSINNLIKDKTVIIIAHRMETIKNADHIIVLDKGKIMQEGTHNQLVNQEGIYKNFILTKKRVSSWNL